MLGNLKRMRTITHAIFLLSVQLDKNRPGTEASPQSIENNLPERTATARISRKLLLR